MAPAETRQVSRSLSARELVFGQILEAALSQVGPECMVLLLVRSVVRKHSRTVESNVSGI